MCNRSLAYDFTTDDFHTLDKENNNIYVTSDNQEIRLCDNYINYDVCNAIVPNDSNMNLCIACQANRVIPDLSNQSSIQKWAKLEDAKRRLIRTFLVLGLPVTPHTEITNGLAFDFLEDQSQNPNVSNEFVSTGHHNGLITINLAEADDIHLENTKNALGEQYRTPLGNLRHESGHYYFDKLIKQTNWIEKFRELFGNNAFNYQDALNEFYASKPHLDWNQNYISEYAMAHPLEDWAECWAHYLHMFDTLETAQNFNILRKDNYKNFNDKLVEWSELSIALNQLNRSMGLKDAYPFVLSPKVFRKLGFVHLVIDPNFEPTQLEGVG